MISLKKQLDAKVYFSMIIDRVVILFIEGMLMFVVKAPLYFWGMLAVVDALVLLINNYICLILDLRSPKLDWSEESEAVKQNLNVFWGTMLSLALSGAMIGAGLIILDSNVNILLIFAITSVILLSIYILINLVVKKYQLKLFNKVVFPQPSPPSNVINFSMLLLYHNKNIFQNLFSHTIIFS